jgi:hypothetical protein
MLKMGYESQALGRIHSEHIRAQKYAIDFSVT